MRRTRSARRANPEPTPTDDSTDARDEDGSESEIDGEEEDEDAPSHSSVSGSGSPTSSVSEAGTDELADARKGDLIEERVRLLLESQKARNRMLREFHALYNQGRVNAGMLLVCDDDAFVDKPAAVYADPPRLTPEFDVRALQWTPGPATPPQVTHQDDAPHVEDVIAPVVDPESPHDEDSNEAEQMDIDEAAQAAATLEDGSESEDRKSDVLPDDDAVPTPRSVAGKQSVVPLVDYGDDSASDDEAQSTRRSKTPPATVTETTATPLAPVSEDASSPAQSRSRSPTPIVSYSPTPAMRRETTPIEPKLDPEASPKAESDKMQVDEAPAMIDDVPLETEPEPPSIAPTAIEPPPPPRPRIKIDPSVLLLPPRSPGGSLITFAPPSPHRQLIYPPSRATEVTALPAALQLRPVESSDDGTATLVAASESSPQLPLPPLSALPASFNIVTKPAKLHRRREKERKESLAAAGGAPLLTDLKASLVPQPPQEHIPLGMNRWAATVRANPVHKLLKKAPKVLLTRDWKLAHDELMFMRAMDKIDKLKQDQVWSFRQPKRSKNPAGVKVHWDYLLDEMKWMRTDFREERKWKLAAAHQLAHAVLEWHETDPKERHLLCAKFRYVPEPEYDETQAPAPVPVDDSEMAIPEPQAALDLDLDDHMIIEGWQPPPPGASDPLGPPSPERVAEFALAGAGAGVVAALEPPIVDFDQLLPPKLEEEEANLNLNLNLNLDLGIDLNAALPFPHMEDLVTPGVEGVGQKPILSEAAVLRPGAKNETLAAPAPGRNSKYAALRDPIMALDDDELWLDLENLDLGLGSDDSPAPALDVGTFLAPQELLAEVFPELELYDGPLVRGGGEKRVDETYTGRLTSTSVYMDVRPTLLSALNPAEKFSYREGRWGDLDDVSIVPGLNADEAVGKAVGSRSQLFPSPRAQDSLRVTGKTVPTSMPARPLERASELHWSSAEDDLLRALGTQFPNNWRLVADWFNAARTTIQQPSDARTAWDCCERWMRLWGAAAEDQAGRESSPPPLPPSQESLGMRTMKRTATTALVGPPPGEPMKRRRTMQFTTTMSQVRKRRTESQKANATAVKRALTSSMHDTHLKISKTSFTVAELARLKQEKDRDEVMRQQVNVASQRIPNMLAQQQLPLTAQTAQRMGQVAQQQRIGQPGLGDPRPATPQQYPPHVIQSIRQSAQVAAQAQAQGISLTPEQISVLRMNAAIQAQAQAQQQAQQQQNIPPEQMQRLIAQRQAAIRLQQAQQNGVVLPVASAPGSGPIATQASPPPRTGSARTPQIDPADMQRAQAQALHSMMQSYSNEEQMRQRVNLQNMIVAGGGAGGMSSSPNPPGAASQNGAGPPGHR